MRRVGIIILLVIITAGQRSYAGITTYNSRRVSVKSYYPLSGTKQVLEVQDDEFHYMRNNHPVGGYPFINHRVQDFVSLQYTGALDQVYGAFSVTVQYELDGWDTAANALGPFYGTLTISYNPTTHTTETYRRDDEYDGVDSAILKITAISYTGVLPADVELTSRIVVDRYWLLNQSQSPAISQAVDIPNNKLNLAWNYLQGAESYDLEWIFVSAYVPSGTPDFSQATRINTTEQNYSINLAYDIGTIYYRIRGVGYMLPIDSERMEAVWTVPQSCHVGDIDKTRNWTYSATYAEQGKRKEVMQFFDGSTRMRQAVTENNTENTALISESIYDYEGRPGVTTLPTPDSADDSKLGFYKWLNLNTAGSPYSRKDFNVETAAQCTGYAPLGMSTMNGSGNYYSQQNPLKSYGVNMAVPDAGDATLAYANGTYPFSETLYNSEGKIAEQAGPGLTLKAGSGHTTQYFYANALQSDLDKVFGNEAGDATHYQEKMTQDQNGQVSITYTDMSGKTVATSIIGPGPTQMDNLIEPNSSPQTYTSDLSSYNTFVAPDDAKEFSPSIAFPVKAKGVPYNFTYTFAPSILNIACVPFNTVIGYDLNITIVDQCGNIVVPTTITVNPVNPAITTLGGVIAGTNLVVPETLTFSVTFPAVGVYYISKKLSLDQNTFSNAVAAYKAAFPGGCAGQTLAQLQTSYSNDVDLTGCATCTSGCGPMDTVNPCTLLFHTMESDMSPGGQYFDNRPPTAPINQPYNNNWLSNMNGPGTTPSNCGLNTYLATNCLPNAAPFANWDDVRANWQPCFAIFLVQNFDPEYCRYKTCRALEENSLTPDITNSSLNYDQYLEENQTYAWATSNPAPLPNSYIDDITPQVPVGLNMLIGDPFFSAALDPGDYNNMLGQLNNYPPSGGLPMWTYATNTAIAQYGAGYTKDEVYKIFLGYYESVKQDYVASWEQANAGSGLCEGFCDQGINTNGEPTGVIAGSGYGCNTPHADAVGFAMRWPDNDPYFYNQALMLSNPITNAATVTTYTNTVGQNNVNFCNTASFAQVINPNNILCIPPPPTGVAPKDTLQIQVYVQQGLNPATDITCIPAVIPIGPPSQGQGQCMSVPPMSTILLDIANAINNSTCNPVGYTATVTYSPLTLTVTAPIALGAGPNGTNLYFTDGYGDPNAYNDGNVFAAGSPGSKSTPAQFGGGITVTPCTPNTAVPNCLCLELGQLQLNYAGLVTNYNNDPNTGINPAVETFEEYAVCALDSGYNLGSNAITGNDVDTWIHNCSIDTNTSPTNHTGLPTVPTGLNCSPTPPCYEDSYNIASYDATVQYNQEVTQAVIQFQADYEAAAYNTLDGYGETAGVTAATWECHYTLYYYDQADNLARTVPPQGVNILNNTQVGAVEAYRSTNIGSPTIPQHVKVTGYNYNSINSVVYENHNPDEGIIQHWYDHANRLRFTQNAKQLAVSITNPEYSYTKYDAQDRVIESGKSNEQYLSSNFYNGVKDETFPAPQVPSSPQNTYEVVHTYYDAEFPGSNANLRGEFDHNGQHNLRARVSTVTYASVGSTNPATYDNATHYSYDELGYENNLVQENTDPFLAYISQQYKKMRYAYDMVSGNVDVVQYQPGALDQYIHKYEYDADNRLTNAYTSTDSAIWDQDAKYFYYLHGSLARMEIGQDKVQGMDYARTLQGWLKGMNSNVISSPTDMGQDGVNNNIYLSNENGIHSNVARDAYGFTLGYFINNVPGNDAYYNDYASIDPNAGDPANRFYGNGVTNLSGEDLFNGNIKQMSVAMEDITNNPINLLDNHYRYDQANRLTNNQPYYNAGSFTNYSAATNTTTWYKSHYGYDPDGNLLSLTRYDNTGTQIDNMGYTYEQLTPPSLTATANMLDNVTNPLGGSIPSGQAAGNYTYDQIGELNKDVQGNIANIDWNATGKVLYITGASGSSEPDIEFKYDAHGERIRKLVKPRILGNLSTQEHWTYTYYVRDPSGNIVATYDRSFGPAIIGGFAFEESFSLSENPIYANERVGTFNNNVLLSAVDFNISGHNPDGTIIMGASVSRFIATPVPYTRTLGFKNYELIDHLGNVLMTVSDRKLPVAVSITNQNVDHFIADVMTSSDYYPFGEAISTRNSAVGDYRFGYDAQEKDDEIYGPGNVNTAEFWEYDTRLGRRWNTDIKGSASLSPYVSFGNNPISLTDLLGDTTKFYSAPDKNGKRTLEDEVPDNSNATFQRTGNGKYQHYEFSGFDESQGGEDKVNLESAILGQERLNTKNEGLESDGPTYCNIALKNVLSTIASATDYYNDNDNCWEPGTKALTFSGDKLANDMASTWLPNNPGLVAVNQDDANLSAADGNFAMLAYYNPGKDSKGNANHGHVAVFVPGKSDNTIANIGVKGWNKNIPLTSGNNGNGTPVCPRALPPKAYSSKNVKYYILNSKKIKPIEYKRENVRCYINDTR